MRKQKFTVIFLETSLHVVTHEVACDSVSCDNALSRPAVCEIQPLEHRTYLSRHSTHLSGELTAPEESASEVDTWCTDSIFQH